MQKEYFSHYQNMKTINISDNRIDLFRNNNTVRKSVRLVHNGKLGISGSKTDMPFDELEQKAGISLQSGVPILFSLPSGKQKSWDIRQLKINDDEFINNCEILVNTLKQKYPDFSFLGTIEYFDDNIVLKNSEGIDYSVKKNHISIKLSYTYNKDIESVRGFWLYNCAHDFNIHSFIEQITPFLDVFSNEISIDNKEIIMLSPSYVNADYEPFSFLDRHLRGGYYENGSSYFSGKTGQKLFSDKFIMYDRNVIESEGICSPFDGDGYMRQDKDLMLFENGVLKNQLHSMHTAAKYKKISTGTSSRKYDEASVIFPNFFMLSDMNQSIKDIDRAIVAHPSGATQDDGSISFSIKPGFLIENGKIKGRVNNFSLVNNINDMLGKDYIGPFKENMFENSLSSKYVGYRMRVNR